MVVQTPEMTPETIVDQEALSMQNHDEMSLPSSPLPQEEAESNAEAASANENTGVFETCVSFDLH